MISVQWIAIDAIKPNARNARTHSKKQIRQIADSITAFGFLVPILIDQGGLIIAGHGRYAAAVLLGLQEVPVIRVEGLSDAKRRALALADNKIGENAGWDRELLATELPESADILIVEGLDISITGFAPVEIDQIATDFEEDSSDPADTVDPEWAKGRPLSTYGDLGNWAITGCCAAMPAMLTTSSASWGNPARRWRFSTRPTMSACVTSSVAARSNTANLPWPPVSSRAATLSSSSSKA